MPTWAAIRIYIQIVAAIVIFSGGIYVEHLRWNSSLEKAEKEAVVVTQKQGDVSTAAAASDAEKQVQIVTKTQTIIRRINVPANLNTPITWGVVRLLDTAAGLDASALATGQPDDAPSPFRIGDIVASVVVNYGTSSENSQQLADLQAWWLNEVKARTGK